jgi:CheY-like chemotaxis protein
VGDVVYAATQFRPRPARVETEAGATARILVVDPDPASLAAMEHVLQTEGYVTAAAFDGLGAFAAAERLGEIDLLITEVQATQMSGAELADLLRRRNPRLPVLYLATCQDELFGEPVSLSGQDDVIEKPFSETELVEAVSALLG